MNVFDIKKIGLEKVLALSALFFISVLGLQIRVQALDFRYFTLDEIVQYQASIGTFSELMQYLWAKDGHPPGFYLLTLLWTKWTAPYNPVLLKLLPTLLGVFGLIVASIASARLWGWAPSLVTAAFLAFSPAEIAHSTNFRMYSGLILGAALFHLALIIMEEKKQGMLFWFLLTASSFFLGWFHHLGFVYQALVLACWLLLKRNKLSSPLIIKTITMVIVVNLVPFIFLIQQNLTVSERMNWIPHFGWLDMTKQTTATFIGSNPWQTPTWSLLLWAAFSILGLCLLYFEIPKKKMILVLMMGTICVPLFLMVKSSIGEPIFYWRYISISLVPFAIGLGAIMNKLRWHKGLQWLLCIGLAGLFYLNSSRFTNLVVKNQWKELLSEQGMILQKDYLTCLDFNRRVESEFHFEKNNVGGRSLGDLCLEPSLIESLPRNENFLLIAEPKFLSENPKIEKSFAQWILAKEYLSYNLYFVKR